MTGKERTIRFLEGKSVDRLPFHPLVMQFGAKQAGVPYREYCLDPKRHVDAMLYCMENLALDYVMTGAYPYTEAIAYGLDVEFPENNLPLERNLLIKDPEKDLKKIKPLKIEDQDLMMRRVEMIGEYKSRAGNELFINGWAEGPMAEYADLRGMTGAFMDVMDYPDEIEEVMGIIVENAKAWIKLQIEAGADCIGIGDAACSQIGPALYEELVFDYHKELAAYIQSLGAYAKIHICGNTTPILPSMIEAGYNIIDVDYLVEDMSPFVDLLGPKQVFLGNVDPVSVIQDGTPEFIMQKTIRCVKQAKGRCIVAAGCEIPRDTTAENYMAFFEACKEASKLVL
jgi:MtaA/CmuA family methyltransferase